MSVPIKIIKEDDTLLVSFSYHPKLVQRIKTLPPNARRWDGVRKVWIVKEEASAQLLGLFKDSNVELEPKNLLEEIAATVSTSTPVRCFICETVIDCDKCSYADSCPVKNGVRYCICLDDLNVSNSWRVYTTTKADFLGLDTS